MKRMSVVFGILAIVITIACVACAGSGAAGGGVATIDQVRNAAAAGVHSSIRLYDVLLKLAGSADRAGLLKPDVKAKIVDAAEKFRGPAKSALAVIKAGGDPGTHLNAMQASIALIEGIVSQLNLSSASKSAALHDTHVDATERTVFEIVDRQPRDYFAAAHIQVYGAMAVPIGLIMALFQFASKYGPEAVAEIKALFTQHGIPTPADIEADEAILEKKPEDIMSGDGTPPATS
jgi:hypothetical protein